VSGAPAATTLPRRERYLTLGLLLGLALAGWGVLVWYASAGSMMPGLTMGLPAVAFVAVWTLMMVAMMFPAAAPMVTTFAAVQASRRQERRSFVPTWVFTGSYLLVWALVGVVAYAVARGLDALAMGSPALAAGAARAGGGLLILAGLYQLSPLKHACLSRCRTPWQFLLTSWRDGYRGAVRMGMEHGAYCLGCCWLLFAILFPLGLMNLLAMVAITALVYAEKTLPFGVRAARVAAVLLVAYGVLVLIVPTALPGAAGAM